MVTDPVVVIRGYLIVEISKANKLKRIFKAKAIKLGDPARSWDETFAREQELKAKYLQEVLDVIDKEVV